MIGFAIAIGEIAFMVWLLNAIEKRGYRKGDEAGYNRGYQEGHKAADNWWMNWEHEVTRTRETIKHESGNEERWP